MDDFKVEKGKSIPSVKKGSRPHREGEIPYDTMEAGDSVLIRDKTFETIRNRVNVKVHNERKKGGTRLWRAFRDTEVEGATRVFRLE